MGQDLLGLLSPHFDVKGAINVLKDNTSIGLLDNTFGAKTDNLSAYLDRKHPSLVRVHLINAVCIRNSNCGRYEIGFGYTSKSFNAALIRRAPKLLNYVRARTAVYRELAFEYGRPFKISPALEHDLSKEAWRVLANTVLEAWPGVPLVNNPNAGVSVERYRGASIERHGAAPRGEIQGNSLDGDDALIIQYSKWLATTKGLEYRYSWTISYNCRKSGIFIDPRKRINCANSSIYRQMTSLP